MKKVLCVILIVSICFFCIISIAEEEKKEILFRNNPWGSSVAEVKKSFPDNLRMWISVINDKPYKEIEYRLFGKGNEDEYDVPVGARDIIYDFIMEKSDFLVAGYPVNEIGLYFAYVPGDDGLIDEENPKTALYFAFYSFKPNDISIVYDDLKNKLTGIYGDPGYEYITQEGEKRYLSWFGENDTVLTLVWSYNTYINIKYGWLNGNNLLQDAYNAILLKEKITDKSDVDGL